MKFPTPEAKCAKGELNIWNLAWSDHYSPCKTSPKKFAPKFFFPYAKLFLWEKFPILCRGEGDTMIYLQIFSYI